MLTKAHFARWSIFVISAGIFLLFGFIRSCLRSKGMSWTRSSKSIRRRRGSVLWIRRRKLGASGSGMLLLPTTRGTKVHSNAIHNFLSLLFAGRNGKDLRHTTDVIGGRWGRSFGDRCWSCSRVASGRKRMNVPFSFDQGCTIETVALAHDSVCVIVSGTEGFLIL